jgi:hypothetical protein
MTKHGSRKSVSACSRAYTLAEAMVCIAVIGVMFISLYAGFSSGFAIIRVTRENLRATQIMLERMETIRLYRWDQLTNSTFIPSLFTNYYYPDGLAASQGGVSYTGSLSVAKIPASSGLPTTYRSDMRQVTVQVGWVSGSTTRQRTATTYVARYGLQNYVYSGTNGP